MTRDKNLDTSVIPTRERRLKKYDVQKTKKKKNSGTCVIRKNIPFAGHARLVGQVATERRNKGRQNIQQTTNDLRGTDVGESETNERSKRVHQNSDGLARVFGPGKLVKPAPSTF